MSSGGHPDLIILQTGRLRGNFYPLEVRHGAPLQHYPFIAGYVKQVRDEAAKTGTPVLLVDLGDSLTGSFASSVTHSENAVSFFNTLKYDAVMLGNLDADVSPETIKALQMPVLCPFATADGQPAMPGTEFSTKLEKNSVKLQLLANFYGATRLEDYPERFPNAFGPARQVKPFRDYSSLIARDLNLRVFEWMKFENDGANPPPLLADLKKMGVDIVLAHRIYGREKIDAWAGGTQNQWEPPVSLNILRNNRGFALARVDLKRDGARWKVVQQQILPMIANTASPDPEVTQEMRSYTQAITKADAKVAVLPKDVASPSILALYMSALASVPGTSVAVYSPESIRAGWSRGDLNASDVYESIPWSTSIVQFELDPDQLKEVRKISTLRFLLAPNLPADKPVTITSSEYFAETMLQRLSLDPSRIRKAVPGPEYTFFVEWLKSRAVSMENSQPTGWTLEGGK